MTKRLIYAMAVVALAIIAFAGYNYTTRSTPVDVPPIPVATAPDAQATEILQIEVAGQANGMIEIQLRKDLAPLHVQRIETIASAGGYDGVVFHRVIGGFMAQTGDVEFGKIANDNLERAGMGGSDMPNLKAEFSATPYVKGTVGMARSTSPDSANSQFFIMFDEAPFLNGQYTVVGQLVSGMDVLDAIKKGNPDANGAVTAPADYMARVRLKAAP